MIDRFLALSWFVWCIVAIVGLISPKVITPKDRTPFSRTKIGLISAFGFFVIPAIAAIISLSQTETQADKTIRNTSATPISSSSPQNAISVAQKNDTKVASQLDYCDAEACPAGSKIVTQMDKGELFYKCPSRELSEYSSTVIGMVSAQKMMTGTLPNISPDTGEPEYQDETKTLLDTLRAKAKVSTFDQAVAKCVKGERHEVLMVMNNHKDDQYIWASDDTGKSFWLPKIFVKPSR